MKKYETLPNIFQNDQCRKYYDILKKKWFYRFLKRSFDIFASLLLLCILFVPSLIIGVIISITSKGGPFFLQKRVCRYGKEFHIIKFRTMKVNSEGQQQVTSKNDNRITKVGHFLRKTHLDEFPQLLNVFVGQMSFVGTRPEVHRFVKMYKNEWFATLLMRPGITSTASYSYDDEAKDIRDEHADEDYLSVVLPKKMKLNLEDIEKSNVFHEIKIMFNTVF